MNNTMNTANVRKPKEPASKYPLNETLRLTGNFCDCVISKRTNSLIAPEATSACAFVTKACAHAEEREAAIFELPSSA
jgi:hypothetical protein